MEHLPPVGYDNLRNIHASLIVQRISSNGSSESIIISLSSRYAAVDGCQLTYCVMTDED